MNRTDFEDIHFNHDLTRKGEGYKTPKTQSLWSGWVEGIRNEQERIDTLKWRRRNRIFNSVRTMLIAAAFTAVASQLLIELHFACKFW